VEADSNILSHIEFGRLPQQLSIMSKCEKDNAINLSTLEFQVCYEK